jgi:hypothetical protein
MKSVLLMSLALGVSVTASATEQFNGKFGYSHSTNQGNYVEYDGIYYSPEGWGSSIAAEADGYTAEAFCKSLNSNLRLVNYEGSSLGSGRPVPGTGPVVTNYTQAVSFNGTQLSHLVTTNNLLDSVTCR